MRAPPESFKADHRAADLHRQVHDLADLRGVGARQRAAEDREVLGEHAHRPTVDGAVAGDHAVAEDLLLLHAEVGAAVGDEAVELDEAARVEQRRDALARGELAGFVLLVDAGLAAAEDGLPLELFEACEGVGHGIPLARARRAARRAYTRYVANVKGSALASRVTWVRLNHGQDGIDRVCAQVSPALAEVVRAGPAVARWYPVAMLVELAETLDRLFGAGDGALIHALGRYGADANLTTIYRLFYRVGTVRWVMARAARLWHLHYDGGRLEVHERPTRSTSTSSTSPSPAAPTATRCAAGPSARRAVWRRAGRDHDGGVPQARRRGVHDPLSLAVRRGRNLAPPRAGA
jgi:hypothetical protein